MRLKDFGWVALCLDCSVLGYCVMCVSAFPCSRDNGQKAGSRYVCTMLMCCRVKIVVRLGNEWGSLRKAK